MSRHLDCIVTPVTRDIFTRVSRVVAVNVATYMISVWRSFAASALCTALHCTPSAVRTLESLLHHPDSAQLVPLVPLANGGDLDLGSIGMTLVYVQLHYQRLGINRSASLPQ